MDETLLIGGRCGLLEVRPQRDNSWSVFLLGELEIVDNVPDEMLKAELSAPRVARFSDIDFSNIIDGAEDFGEIVELFLMEVETAIGSLEEAAGDAKATEKPVSRSS